MARESFHGFIDGRIIQLTEEPGVPNGQAVEVVVLPTTIPQTSWGEGLKRCAGSLASDWSEEDDRILLEIQETRRQADGREPAE